VSEQNVEIVRGIYAEWSQGDFSSNDWADPEIAYEIPEPSGNVHRGIEAMERAWLNWASEWEDLKIRLTDIRDLGDEVLTVHTFHGKGRASGVPVDELPGAGIFSFRDGKVVRYRGYTNVDDALADAGVADEGG
jgi:ketosteroid isomerase-like protein